MTLKDKVVVITGGSKGFGKALAQAFIKEGSKVVICARLKDVYTTAEEIGALGVRADVSQEEDLITVAQFTLNKLEHHIDIWVNNAGIWMGGPAEEADMAKVKRMFGVNVIGMMNGSRVALREMKEKKSGTGTIMNIISKAGLEGRAGLSVYAATKWAANGFTKSIREENKDNNISVLSVFPGGMKTEMFGKTKPDNFNDFMDVDEVAGKVIENLKKDKPEEELIIKR